MNLAMAVVAQGFAPAVLCMNTAVTWMVMGGPVRLKLSAPFFCQRRMKTLYLSACHAQAG